MLYKRKNIDAITSNKFNLNNILEITEGELLRNPNPSTESFDIYENIEKYSAGLTKGDLVKFYNKVFINKDNLRLTSYVYAQKNANFDTKKNIFNYTIIN